MLAAIRIARLRPSSIAGVYQIRFCFAIAVGLESTLMQEQLQRGIERLTQIFESRRILKLFQEPIRGRMALYFEARAYEKLGRLHFPITLCPIFRPRILIMRRRPDLHEHWKAGSEIYQQTYFCAHPVYRFGFRSNGRSNRFGIGRVAVSGSGFQIRGTGGLEFATL